MRRRRERYERFGYHGLIDRRYQRPSQRRVRLVDVECVVGLAGSERYAGFNSSFERTASGKSTVATTVFNRCAKLSAVV